MAPERGAGGRRAAQPDPAEEHQRRDADRHQEPARGAAQGGDAAGQGGLVEALRGDPSQRPAEPIGVPGGRVERRLLDQVKAA